MEFDREKLREIISAMCRTFDEGRYDETLSSLNDLGDLGSLPGSIRVPAVAIGSRALVRKGDKGSAEALLKKAGRGAWTDIALYDMLAIAMIEVKNHTRAMELLAKSLELTQARKAKGKVDKPDA